MIISCKLLSDRCLWINCPPERVFDLSELIIPGHYFPEGYDGGRLRRRSDIATLSYYGAGRRWGEGLTGSTYTWALYGTFNQAKNNFIENTNITKSKFKQYSLIDDIENVLAFTSIYTRDYWVSCGDYLFEHYSCMYGAAYGENVIYFSSNVSIKGDNLGEEMGAQEFLAIISYIDTVIAPRLLDINE